MGMRIVIVLLIAYLITGIHFVWRDITAEGVDRPGYVRNATLPFLMSMVLCWLPLTVLEPWIVGWQRWKRHVLSLLLYAGIVGAGILIVA